MGKHWYYLTVVIVCFLVTSCGPTLQERKSQAEDARMLGEGYLGEGNVPGAFGEFVKAQALYDQDPYTYYGLGLAYMARGDHDKAIAQFEKAAELKEDYSEAYNAMGIAYLRLEKWDNAIEQFNNAKANIIYATPYVVYNNLGEAYRGKKDYRRATEYYHKALKDNPQYANAYRGMALIKMEQGDYGAAIGMLKRAVQHAPDFPVVRFDLARAYVAVYENEKALDEFHKVVALDPTSPLAVRAMDEIEKLEGP